ncbi:MAG: toll/interleukin-1 receptor domain-containing protein, partial [Bacilli bacterium]|nr:toll/interleukin-1 receptor domain-containing protein [Bacilli bacterium]
MINKTMKIKIKRQVFISWNHLDEEILDSIVSSDYFSEDDTNKITVWHSNGKEGYGSLEEIMSQISLCELFLIIISPNSIKSKWVYDEFNCACKKLGENAILPIIINYEEVSKQIKDSFFSDS